MKKTQKIKRPIGYGIKTFVLVFDGKEGKHKRIENGGYFLNPKEKIECISIIDARAVLLKYLQPAHIPNYNKCREIVKREGYLSVMKFNDKYILG